jgi:hypothetical protein
MPNMPGMAALYRDVPGLKLHKDAPGRKEFDANDCTIALHNGTSATERRPHPLRRQGSRRQSLLNSDWRRVDSA